MAAAAAAAAAAIRDGANLLGAAAQPSTPVNFDVPAGACDCHTHVFGDPQRFPFAAVRPYTPEPASVAEQRSLHRSLHTGRVVLVQPTVYGTDNSCTVDAMKQLGGSSRGVAVIDDLTPEAALDDMHRAGIRGIRINLETAGQTDPALGRQRLAGGYRAREDARMARAGVYTALGDCGNGRRGDGGAGADCVRSLWGHAGGAGVGQPGFDTLLKLVQAGKAYVKISAPYRSSTMAPDYPDVAPLAKALIAANVERTLWATDWPHPAQIPGRKFDEITPLFQIDDGRVFNLLPAWAPEAGTRKTILVDNPAKLYRF